MDNNSLEVVPKEERKEDLALTDVAVKPSSPPAWKDNPYLPTHPTLLRSPEEKALFLVKVKELKYNIRAAHALGYSVRLVQRRMVEDIEFALAVDAIHRDREMELYNDIEEVSEREALKEGRNSDRLKQLDALGPEKYRRKDVGVQVATQINITLGYQPPRPPAMKE